MSRKFVRGVQFLDHPDPIGTLTVVCPCGWGLTVDADQVHPQRHYEWAHGPQVPAALGRHSRDGITAIVDLTAPVAWRQLAYHMTGLAQRDQMAQSDAEYPDIAMPYPDGPGRRDDDSTRALLYIHRGHVRGYLALYDMPTAGQSNPHHDSQDIGSTRPAIGTVFVAGYWRRYGIATALVHAAAEHTGTPVEELAWRTPFTPDGQALMRHLAGPAGTVWAA